MSISYADPKLSRRTGRHRAPPLSSVAFRAMAAGLRTLHRAIVAAKIRRLERELLFHDLTYDLTREGSRFPRTPVVLGEKWDS